MKKTLVLLLAALMLMCSVGVSSAETYEPHIKYNGSGWMLNTGANYDDAYYAYFTEKFNMDFEPYFTDRATNDEKVNLLVNTASMPDGLIGLEFNYDAYLEWVDQGLIAPLPDGWEVKYPDLYRMIENTGTLEKITVDGQVYVIPHAIWHNFVNMEVPVGHTTIYYRKDWAEKLGMSHIFEGDVVKITDLLEFAKKAVEANLGDNGTTVGLTGRNAKNLVEAFTDQLPYDFSKFVKTEEGYKWAPTLDGMVDTIKSMREYYQAGAIDPDFYLGNGLTTFTSGGAAALYAEGSASSTVFLSDFVNAHSNLVDELAALKAEDPSKMYFDTSVCDYVGFAVIADADGVVHGRETTNYWSFTIFNPDIDEQVFDRILSLINWACTPDGEVTTKVGIPGVDWSWSEDGKTIVQHPNANGTYNTYDSRNMLTQYALCSDEMALVKKDNAPQLIEFVKKMYEIKSAGVIVPYDYDYKFFTSQAKSEYSVDIAAQIIALVVDDSLDIDTVWANFINENAGMVDPLIKDLNAAFCK